LPDGRSQPIGAFKSAPGLDRLEHTEDLGGGNVGDRSSAEITPG
jgi:hypothetical protein